MTTMTTEQLQQSHRFKAVKLKVMEGHDGHIIRFDLLVDGVLTAHYFDDGNGGMADYDVVNPTKFAEYEAFTESLPSFESYGIMLDMNSELYAGDLVDRAANEKSIVRAMKTYTVYRTPECRAGAYFKHKAARAVVEKNEKDAIFAEDDLDGFLDALLGLV